MDTDEAIYRDYITVSIKVLISVRCPVWLTRNIDRISVIRRVLHSGSKTQDKGMPETTACRILMLM